MRSVQFTLKSRSEKVALKRRLPAEAEPRQGSGSKQETQASAPLSGIGVGKIVTWVGTKFSNFDSLHSSHEAKIWFLGLHLESVGRSSGLCVV